MCLLLCSKDNMERWTWMNSQGYPIERSLICIGHSPHFSTCIIFRRISKIWCQISSIIIRVQNIFQHQCWGLRKGPATELLLVLELRSKPEGDIQKRLQVNLSQLGAQRLRTKCSKIGYIYIYMYMYVYIYIYMYIWATVKICEDQFSREGLKMTLYMHETL